MSNVVMRLTARPVKLAAGATLTSENAFILAYELGRLIINFSHLQDGVCKICTRRQFSFSFAFRTPDFRRVLVNLPQQARISHGKPVIRGTRVPVTVVVGSLAGGMTFDEIEHEYDLMAEDIRAALKFVGEIAQQESFHPLPAA